jgi:hypothetical protein
MNRHMMYLSVIGILVLFFTTRTMAQTAPATAWGVQLGSIARDFPRDVSADADGNSYIVGETDGAIGGTSAGKTDGFVVKYNADGTLVWVQQLGTTANDYITGIDVGPDNTIAILGYTMGTMGTESFGNSDLFVCRMDGQGNKLWLQQIGSSKADSPNRIVHDRQGNIYFTGKTTGILGEKNEGSTDVFVFKYDNQGNRLWVCQFGTSKSDEGMALTVNEAGETFVAGITYGGFDISALGDADAFLAKLDQDGKLAWVRQFGTNTTDNGRGVALDVSGNIYVGGWTGGLMGERIYGQGDAFITYFDKDGNRMWTKQFGTGNWDGAHGMAAMQDGSGDALIGGCWNWPSCHGWMRRYNNKGELVWEKLIYKNAAKASCGQTVFVDHSGNCYHVGATDDDLYGELQGGQDAFLVKLSTVSNVEGQKPDQDLPMDFKLFQNCPNPFNPDTEIRYSLSREAYIRLTISNTSGQTIKTLMNGRQPQGEYTVRWNGCSEQGYPVCSGVYLYQLTASQSMATGKMLLMR